MQKRLPLVLGVSSCLLGEKVRYDGDQRRNNYIVDILGRYAEFVSLCPEVSIGLGVPRPPIQLQLLGGHIRVRGVEDRGLDVTEALQDYARQQLPRLGGISAYIFKARSPSCGLHGVVLHDPAGNGVGGTSGMFCASLRHAMPNLPMAEEGELEDATQREHFLEQLFVYHRWREYESVGMSAKALVEFHTQHKYLIQSHDEIAYRQLGNIVAEAGADGLGQRCNYYVQVLMQAMSEPSTMATHTNVLQHIIGYFKHSMSAAEKHQWSELLQQYRDAATPRTGLIEYIRQLLQRYPNEYIARQFYLAPFPSELMPVKP